jgi:hypothetical protein
MTTTTTLDRCTDLLDTPAPVYNTRYRTHSPEELEQLQAEATRVRADDYAAITAPELVSEDVRVDRLYAGSPAEVLRQIAADLDEFQFESDRARGEPNPDPNRPDYPYGAPGFSVARVHYNWNRQATEIRYRTARRRALTPEQIEARAQQFLQKWTPPGVDDVPF